MGRSVIPQVFSGKVTLFKNLKKKVDSDGAEGVLVAMLAEKKINLSTDSDNCVLAVAYDTNFKSLLKSSQNLHQQGKELMKPIIENTTGSLQYLKTLFDPNFKAVGDYGATISDTGKFTYPVGTVAWMDLFASMKTKNDSFVLPLVSPLVLFNTENKISFTLNATNGALALVKQTDCEEDTKSSELARQKRDTKFAPVLKDIRAIIQFLMKLYPDNVKQLGLYGITIVLTPKVAKAKTINLIFGQSKLKVKLTVGSIISNTGTEAINIYKGKDMSGTPTSLAAGKKWIVTKGFSTASFGNNSLTNDAEFTILPKS